ncbi:MAG: choice-of-anchor D domain-containing protein [Alphaproteobacteria bacterium]|nr:choice-of-anchor D domain-containing protein [Alphaproteobacteria bacterium]
MIRRVAPVALLALTTACSDHGFTATEGMNDGSTPAIAVSPARIDFGVLGADDEAVVRTFLVESVGGADLSVEGMEILGDDLSFVILDEDQSFSLPATASREIPVVFLPMGANPVAQVLIHSNDPDQPVSVVDLLGEGAVPELQIQPDPLDFGEAWIGCTDQQDVYLENVGTDDLVISDLRYEGDAHDVFDEALGITLPLTLAPGETAQLLIDFTPDDVGEFRDKLVVDSNEPRGSRNAVIVGDGAYAGEYVDRWELPVDPPSDIMFLVDQSGSMDDDQRRLGENFTTFISELSAYTDDWQVVVVNDDDGCYNSGILTRRTSGYQTQFSNSVSRGGGTYTEALLLPAANGVEKTDPGECNHGFLREGAMLHIIVVSDEPNQTPLAWSNYVDQIIAKKGSAANVRISAIAGPTGTSSCAQPGTGYAEAVDATGGVFLNICNNWATSANLALLAEASVFQDTYELSRDPVVETIEVSVNGTRRELGWSYDGSTNAVVFSGNVPGEADVVEVSYAAYASCD